MPELAVLLAYTKIVLDDELVDTDLPDDPFMRGHLFRYFPTPMRESYRDRMDAHPLRREIVVTQVVNNLVNHAGITFFHRLSGETGATADELARAHAIASEIYGAEALYGLIGGLDHQVDARADPDAARGTQLVERATRWLVNERWHADAEGTVDQVGTELRGWSGRCPTPWPGATTTGSSSGPASLATRASPRSWRTASPRCRPPTAHSRSSRWRSARQRPARGRPGAQRGRPAAQHRPALRPGGRAATRRPLADHGARCAARRPAARARRPHRQVLDAVGDDEVEGADESRLGSTRGMQEGVVFDRALATLTEICRDDAADLARLSVALRVARTLLG